MYAANSLEQGVTGIDNPFMQKPAELLNAAFDLFKLLPTDGDERWPFLARYAEVKAKTGFRPINFANAWGQAIYLSEEPSYRVGFVTSISDLNCLQLDRAIDNLAKLPEVEERFEKTKPTEEHDVRLRLTDRLTTDPTKAARPETPCPEALYQLRLYHAGVYLARVGFNLHVEDGEDVMSIVNIQGIPNSREKVHAFSVITGVSPFNILVQRAVAIAEVADPTYIVRGLINPKRGNSRLYYGVFDQERIDMFHGQHKKI